MAVQPREEQGEHQGCAGERVRRQNGVRARSHQQNGACVTATTMQAVTDELVELVWAPSCDANAREVFVSVITGACMEPS